MQTNAVVYDGWTFEKDGKICMLIVDFRVPQDDEKLTFLREWVDKEVPGMITHNGTFCIKLEFSCKFDLMYLVLTCPYDLYLTQYP